MPRALAGRRDAIFEEWLADTLDTYPAHTARFLRQEKDRFRNPAGHALREGCAVVVDELLGSMETVRIGEALDSILRIRAVQDFTAAQAVAFLFRLKRIACKHMDAADAREFEERIDEVALAAFDVFMRCREQLYEARMNESRRRFAVIERAARSEEV